MCYKNDIGAANLVWPILYWGLQNRLPCKLGLYWSLQNWPDQTCRETCRFDMAMPSFGLANFIWQSYYWGWQTLLGQPYLQPTLWCLYVFLMHFFHPANSIGHYLVPIHRNLQVSLHLGSMQSSHDWSDIVCLWYITASVAEDDISQFYRDRRRKRMIERSLFWKGKELGTQAILLSALHHSYFILITYSV